MASRGQNLTGDSVWIKEIGAKGLVILSKDSRSLCGIHRGDIEKAAAKVFILQRARKDGPMIYRLYPKQLEKVL